MEGTFGRRSSLATGGAALLLPGSPSRAQGNLLVPKVKVGSLELSQSIQGQWQLAGKHGAITEEEGFQNMRNHVDAGFTTIDTADIYNASERIIGKFLQTEPRATVCTKNCWFRKLDKMEIIEVRLRVDEALKKLQLKQIPLTHFYWGVWDIARYAKAAVKLCQLRDEGLIQEVGVTNFDTIRLKELVEENNLRIASHQLQLSVFDRRPLAGGMADYCQSKGIKLICYGVTGGGLLSERYLGAPDPGNGGLTTPSLELYYLSAKRYVGNWSRVQELLQTLKQVGQKYGVSIANVAQRYVLDCHPSVACILVGVRNSNHIAENVQTYSFKLDADDFKVINAVLDKGPGPKGDVYAMERGLLRDGRQGQ